MNIAHLFAAILILAISGCATPEVNNSPPQQCNDTDVSACAEVCDEVRPDENSVTSTTTCFASRCACGFTDSTTDSCSAFFRRTVEQISCPTNEEKVQAFADEESNADESNEGV